MVVLGGIGFRHAGAAAPVMHRTLIIIIIMGLPPRSPSAHACMLSLNDVGT